MNLDAYESFPEEEARKVFEGKQLPQGLTYTISPNALTVTIRIQKVTNIYLYRKAIKVYRSSFR